MDLHVLAKDVRSDTPQGPRMKVITRTRKAKFVCLFLRAFVAMGISGVCFITVVFFLHYVSYKCCPSRLFMVSYPMVFLLFDIFQYEPSPE
jgi:hypothetical protein